jgi:hypothetical protein
MSDIAWEIGHSVEADVTAAFAWTYWTNVANWDDPPASFKLDGSFAAGSRGTTLMPGAEPRYWRVREVHPMESFTLEMPLDGATLSFEWRFEPLPGARTRLTQHIVLEGEKAAAYVDQIRAGFAPNLAAGMKKIAAVMAQAEAREGAG